MFTAKTNNILDKITNSEFRGNYVPGIENVHLRGAMFGFYKAGSGTQRDENNRLPDKGLQLMKPGKLLKMMNGSWSDKTIEVWVNKIKSYVSIWGDEHNEGVESPNFSVVSGELIGHYYLEHNYADIDNSSNLKGSCMRHECNQPSFRIYQENPDKISMLILRNADHKIVARALLWFDGTDTYMDTIYHLTDAHKESMISYANKHGIYYKAQQSCHYFAFDMLNGKQISPKILVLELNYASNWQMPWLDTMLYGFKKDDKYFLTNTMHEGIEADRWFHLRSTSGCSAGSNEIDPPSADRMLRSEVAFTLLYGRDMADNVKIFLDNHPLVMQYANDWKRDKTSGVFANIIKDPRYRGDSMYKRAFINTDVDDEEREGMVYVQGRGEWYDEDDCVCDVDDEYILYDEAVEVGGYWYHQEDERLRYSESRGRYYHQDDVSWVESRQDYYPNEYVVFCEYNGEDIHQDNAMYVDDYGYVHEDDVQEVAVYVDGDWVLTEKCFKCEISDRWYLNSDRLELPDGRSVCKEEYDNWMEENQDDEEEVDEKP